MTRTEPSINIKRRLSWQLSDDKCQICKCLVGRFETSCFLGEFAHIYDLREATTRYDSSKSIDELNSHKNLMILCPTCHTKIDKNSAKYPVDYLKNLKKEHEENVKNSLASSNSEHFKKFDVVIKNLRRLKTNSNYQEYDYNLIETDDKIKKNSLEDYSLEIHESLDNANYYIEFLETLDHLDKMEIRTTVISIYMDYLKKGYSGTELLNKILVEVCSNQLALMNYSLILVCYYFEECDVFEK
ncbi:HNH endonuclease [Listeria monocytogenes]|uniref:HNH endonuclease n=1 Tax=Listeria monocytogenes TaxID=1639 RepID=UPI00085465A8|nr:HNH endonuclease [Listeria monocytogenes]EGD7122562.1 HNH endonuclease [Listeria monocytogenes]EGS3236367.1 HNH endonuclease [Listeria monocytogenes]EII0189434.1 HNH endonuclease [Listeria monocytogenes]ELY0881193.1 HNH endonuclease [Listeria monocytogenes]OER24733.1 hypothetical protein AF963_08970 [Listeria monocytogenes]